MQFYFVSIHYIFKFNITWRCHFRHLSGMTIEDNRPDERVLDESDGEEEEDEDDEASRG